MAILKNALFLSQPFWIFVLFFSYISQSTVKLDFKELLIKEQIDFKELFTDYQLFYTINLLLNKELLPIYKMQNLALGGFICTFSLLSSLSFTFQSSKFNYSSSSQW